jgi:hypothetical protein
MNELVNNSKNRLLDRPVYNISDASEFEATLKSNFSKHFLGRIVIEL